MSQTRANLRLLDDLPMIQYSLEYGLGEKEPDRLMGAIGVLTNTIDHIYYPVDKVCWLIEQKIINVKNPEKWDTLNSLFWVASIYLNLMKWVPLLILSPAQRLAQWLIFSPYLLLRFDLSQCFWSEVALIPLITTFLLGGFAIWMPTWWANALINWSYRYRTIRLVYVMRQHQLNLDKAENESSVALKRLGEKERMEIISILRLSLDFVHAASTLPSGWLWGGKFSNYTVGLIGSTSSLIGLYQYFAKKRLAKN